MTQNKLRLGVIGAGAIGQVHMREFSQHEDVAVVAVADAFRPLAEKAAQEHQIEKVYEQYQDLLQDDGIDAVVIGVPNKFHAPVAIEALKAGKHVYLEKPMGIDAASAKEIVRTQRSTGKLLMVGHQMRFEQLSLSVKEQVQSGALGSIHYAKAGWFRRKGIPGWGSWFTRKEEAGGGPLIDIGVHMLDLTLWLMGNPKPVSVYGTTFAEFGPKKRGIGNWGTPNWEGYYDVEDLATALIKMEDGSTLSLEVSWAVHMNTSNQPFVHLMGSEGGASLDGNTGKLLTEKFNQPLDVDIQLPKDEQSSRYRISRHFIESIKEGKEPITSAMSGLTNNLILDAIYESSKTGHEVKLDWSI